MTADDLKTMVDYHYWARDRLLEAVAPLTPEQYTRNLGSSFASIRDTLTHTYAAEWAWYSRWQGQSPAALVPSDRFADLAALTAAWRENETNVRAFIDASAGAVDRIIEYTLLSGQPGASPIWQMVQHVVNHASYHRGQVTTILRQLGAPPAKPMDMIAYDRVKGSEARA